MAVTLDGWLDVTSPIAALRRGPCVTVAWRTPGKGRPALEFCMNMKLAAELGWTGGVVAKLLLSPAGDAIAFVPDPAGKVLRDRGKGCVASHRLDWMDADTPPRPAEPAEHQVQGSTLIVTLPAWAKRPDVARFVPAAVDLARSPLPTAVPPAAPPAAARTQATANALSGLPHDKLTPERAAKFKELWPRLDVRVTDICDALNRLPGEPYSAGAMAYLAKRLGLPTARGDYATGGQAEAKPPPAAPATEQRAEDEREAEALIRADAKSWHGRAITEEFGWPLDQGAAFVTRVRAKIEAERAAAE